MSLERARATLERYGMADRILTFETSTATVDLAAQALGVEGAQIAKSLTFQSADAEGAIMVIAAGDARIDNARFKAQFHTKAKMLTPDQVSARIGHEVGGVCPFGVREGVTVALDASLRRFDVVYPACGDAHSAVRMTPDELERVTGGEWVQVTKP